ncbi:MAG: hypothetical protein JNK65_02200, partial [Deltaproteobacteria bacterium]|nr:hypothetical protein [Deltaproteobacteria bacterium]
MQQRTPLSFEGFIRSNSSARWQIHYPAREEAPLSDIRRVEGVTPRENDQIILTFDHQLPETSDDYQLIVDRYDVKGLEVGDTIEITHRNRSSITPPPPQVIFGTTEMRMEGDAYRLVSPPSSSASEQNRVQIEAITPIQSTADKNGVARMGILTFSENSPVTQLVVTYAQAQNLQVGQKVELSRLER